MGQLFDEGHFFICSGGLKPCRSNAGQQIMVQEEGHKYLTEKSLTCLNGDYACKKIALLAAIIAAMIAMLCAIGVGWVLLIAIGAAAAGAAGGMLLCGHKAAVARSWVVIIIKAELQIGENSAVANRTSPQLKCSVFDETISFAPNIHTEFHALFLFGCNVGVTGLEGFMYAYATRGLNLLFTAPETFIANFGVNYLKSLAAKGLIWRGVFAIWGGISTYSNSETEGADAWEIAKSAAGGAFFAEAAAARLTPPYMIYKITQVVQGKESLKNVALGSLQDAALLLSFGGIPAGKPSTEKNSLGMRKAPADANSRDFGREEARFKANISNTLEAARQFRNQLKGEQKGKGAHESGKPNFTDPRNTEVVRLLDEAKQELKNATSFEDAAKIGEKLANDIANSEKISNRQKPGNVSLYEKNGKFYLDTSMKPGSEDGTVRGDATEGIKKEYDNLSPNRGNGHGNCGEVGAYSQADAEGNFGEGKKQSWGIKGKNVFDQPSCKSCEQIDFKYEIKDMSPSVPKQAPLPYYKKEN